MAKSNMTNLDSMGMHKKPYSLVPVSKNYSYHTQIYLTLNKTASCLFFFKNKKAVRFFFKKKIIKHKRKSLIKVTNKKAMYASHLVRRAPLTIINYANYYLINYSASTVNNFLKRGKRSKLKKIRRQYINYKKTIDIARLKRYKLFVLRQYIKEFENYNYEIPIPRE